MQRPSFMPACVRTLAIALAAASLVALCGCGGSGSALDPAFAPTVTSVVDTLRLQATAITAVTRPLSYSFRNTGAAATIEQACTITAGSAFLVLRDSTGILLYSKDLSQSGAFSSFAGEPGSWTVELSLADLKGTLDVRVRRKS